MVYAPNFEGCLVLKEALNLKSLATTRRRKQNEGANDSPQGRQIAKKLSL